MNRDGSCDPQDFKSCASTNSARRAKKNYKRRKHNFFLSKLPLSLKEESFDVITFLEVIEHCDNKENNKIIKEIYRLLKPNGILIITTPNYSSFWPILEKIISFIGPIDYTKQHINKFNKTRLNNFLKINNFVEVKTKTFIYLAPFVASINWKLAKYMEKIENNFFKTNFGFLLCGIFKKRK